MRGAGNGRVTFPVSIYMAKTIVALSTPSGLGAISIVRLSGDRSIELLKRAFKPLGGSELQANMLTLGNIELGGIHDRVMAVIFPAPRSYTGEDMAEVHCHGSPEIVVRLIRGFISLGASPAEAGEFTKRAFLNGKISLDEAEAVSDLINARSQAQINAAYSAAVGRAHEAVKRIYDDILSVVAALEAAIDYPEEDIEEETAERVLGRLEGAREALRALIETYGQGEKVRSGIKVAIVGAPNAGKSSLLNRLLGRDRAIVSAEAGTTRDTIEESYEYRGMLFTLVDTAGLRKATDEAEIEGVKRSEAAAKQADIVLRITDLSDPISADVRTDAPVIEVYNKSDIANPHSGGINISALTGEGVDALKEEMYRVAVGANIETGGAMLTNARHYGLAVSALSELDLGISDVGLHSADCTLVGLHGALRYLGEITGSNATEDVIGEVFSKFCVGK